MSEQIKIWLVGNTGLRNPNRIQEGFLSLLILRLSDISMVVETNLGL